MKITAFFLFFINILTVFGQDYKPMLDSKSHWHEYFTPGPWCNATLRIDGDSIVNGVSYKKIFADPSCAAILDEGSFRFLREDTLEKKIYELWSLNHPEGVIYDFSLMPGDTFYWDEERFMILDSITDHIVNPFYCGIDDIPVLSIENPRVFYFHGASYPVIWIEGIGSLTGLLYNYLEWGGGIGERTLLCHYNEFQERDFYYIYCEEQDMCEGVVGDIDDIISNNLINIYPNPTTHQVTLDFKKIEYFKNVDLIVYNLNGQVQMSMNYNYKDKITFDLGNMPKGIYFIKFLIDNEQIYIQRIIKQ